MKNGPLPAKPFARFRGSVLHRLSRYADDPAPPPKVEVSPEAKAKIIEDYKATLPKAPDKYEVKLPDKAILPATALEKVSATARELGLTSNESAQRLVELLNGEAQSVADRIAADYGPGGAKFEEQRRTYEAAALQAPDIGNGSSEVMQGKVARVTTFTNKHFSDDVRDLINKTGIGSHPGFFRSMLKLADLMKEDGYVPGPPAKPGKSAADILYGSSK